MNTSLERESAHIIIENLLQWINPKEVIQLGCGEGIWLQEFKSRGIAINGVDSEDYARTSFWQENPSEFLAADLRQQIVSSPDSLDLAISLETANKLEEDKAMEFVRSLCNLSDVVLFSAAVPGQNEDDANAQMQSYWEELFRENDYVALDCIRSKVWDNERIDVRYRQNLMLYVKEKFLAQYPLLFEFYTKHCGSMIANVLHPVYLGRADKRRRRKILYSYYHSGAFGWVLIHKLTMHRHDDAYLLLTDAAADKNWISDAPYYHAIIEKFIKSGIFCGIYTYNCSLGLEGTTVEQVEKKIFEGLESALSKQECDIESFDKIYHTTDFEDAFGVYLAMKRIRFEWFEMAPNVSSGFKEELMKNIKFKNRVPYRTVLLKYKTYCGENECQTYGVFPNSNPSVFPYNMVEKCNYFDPNIAAMMISDNDKREITKNFGIANIDSGDSKVLILLSSSSWPGVLYSVVQLISMLYKNHMAYYYASIQTVMDYFLPENTMPILKPHPNNIIDDEISKKYFLGAQTYHSLFTVPLMKILSKECVPKYAIVPLSTSSSQLDDSVNKIYAKSPWLFSVFYQKFYATCVVLYKMDVLFKNVGDRFLSIGILGSSTYFDESLPMDINSMVKIQFFEVAPKCDMNYVVMQYKPEKIGEVLERQEFIIYTDVWMSLSIDQLNEIREKANVAVVQITKKAVKKLEDILVPLKNEYIFLISKDESYIDKVGDLSVHRRNKVMGIDLIIQSVSWEEYMHDIMNERTLARAEN